MRSLLLTSAATAATSVIGALASKDANSLWFRTLSKPAFQPPPIAFPIVWTALYADIAVSSATVIDDLDAADRTDESTAFTAALAANLVLNGSWTWVFFRAHRLAEATVVAGALTVSSADLVRRSSAISTPAAAALTPYAAWCAFATVLSGTLWWRNR
ncbi:TspO/MBR family protein [Williamsia maris]|uniref:TspO and MBR related proteins n=1 Tax=Williamsia maris TaxID=72806 RepID=A0ABT1HE80_9NOCA|nr:TspO/MBR family protein [Williamsia maris]MCP2176494.1 TspO and MBR related proteins [Williamsia maris]